nr:hypothetical protein [Variovorax sp. DXTD-1]
MALSLPQLMVRRFSGSISTNRDFWEMGLRQSAKRSGATSPERLVWSKRSSNTPPLFSAMVPPASHLARLSGSMK